MLVKVGVVGATGYAGVELFRRLLGHPDVEIALATSEGQAGRRLDEIHPGLLGFTDLVLEITEPAVLAEKSQVVFLSLPSGKSAALAADLLERGVKVIDLGADFRLKDPENFAAWYGISQARPELLPEAVYGLPELFRAEVAGARLVANPGCYPTASILGAAPILAAGLAEPRFVVDAKSGLSGAGRSANLTTQWVESQENVQPYGIAGEHRHTPEIEEALGALYNEEIRVSFSPHRVPMSRGILATLYFDLRLSLGTDDLLAIYQDFYRGETFVRVRPDLPGTREVRGTNACHLGVRVDRRTGKAVVASAIDNLGKGAAGQAVQNLNLLLGFPEERGLAGTGLWP